MKKNAILLASMFGVLTLSACVSDKKVVQPEQKKVMLQTEEIVKNFVKKGSEQKFVREHDGAWLLGQYVNSEESIDPRLKHQVIFTSSKFVLPYLASRLTENTNLSFKLSDDLYETGSDWKTYGGTTATQTPQSNPVNDNVPEGGSKDSSGLVTLGSPLGMDTLMNATSSASTSRDASGTVSGVKNPFTDNIKVVHSGSIKSLLDKVSGAYGISWRFDAVDGVVWFYRTKTQMFTLKFPGTSKYQTKTDSGEGSKISKIDAEMGVESDKWEDAIEAIKPMLTRFGNVRMVKSAGQLIVTDTPNTLNKVSEYVDHLNDIYNRKVSFQVQVLSVQMENNENYGLSLNNLGRLIGKDKLSFSGGLPLSGSAESVVATASGVSGRITGDLVYEALSKRYETSVVKSAMVSGTHAQPIMMKSIRDVGYISGQSYDAVSDAGSTTSIETSTTQSGLSMVIVPRIDNSRDIYIDVSMELSDLVELRTYTGSLIETPLMDIKTVSARTRLTNNQTVVLNAFEVDSDTDTRSGVGSERMWALGGGQRDASKREKLLVLITPVISN